GGGGGRGDPKKWDRLMSFGQVPPLGPGIDWTAYLDDAHLPRTDFNVLEPKFVREVEHELKRTTPRAWRDYLAWHVLRSAAPWLSKPIVEEWFAFDRNYLAGDPEMKQRRVRCARMTDQLLG